MFSNKDFRVHVTMSPKRGRDNIDVDDEDGDGEGETLLDKTTPHNACLL